MRATSAAGDAAGRRTFTESARRAQIVAAAIETIADNGYAHSSFTKIAKQAGLSSTGMISYHFAGKEDLVRAVVEEVLRGAAEFMRPRIEAARGAGHAAMLRAYIEANIELAADRPRQLRALLDIFNSARTSSGSPVVHPAVLTSRVDLFVAHFTDGQRSGAFGPFDPRVMALAVVAAIDALVAGLTAGHELEPGAAGRELADAFDRATLRH